MNYYYDLPLELQNKIEDFLLIKPKDNELLNNEDEIVKQYQLYKTKFDRITLKNKLSNIANFNQFTRLNDWECDYNCIINNKEYKKYLDQEYIEYTEILNKFQELFTKFNTYQELYYKIKAIKEIKKIQLKLEDIEEYNNDAKIYSIKSNYQKIEDDSYSIVFKKYKTELDNIGVFKNEYEGYNDYNKHYFHDFLKKYRILNTTYERTNYYTYKIPLEEEFVNDIELLKNIDKDKVFQLGKFYKENDYELTITNIANVMVCFNIIFYKNSSMHDQLISRKIFKNDGDIEYIKLTKNYTIYANELNSNKVIS